MQLPQTVRVAKSVTLELERKDPSARPEFYASTPLQLYSSRKDGTFVESRLR